MEINIFVLKIILKTAMKTFAENNIFERLDHFYALQKHKENLERIKNQKRNPVLIDIKHKSRSFKEKERFKEIK